MKYTFWQKVASREYALLSFYISILAEYKKEIPDLRIHPLYLYKDGIVTLYNQPSEAKDFLVSIGLQAKKTGWIEQMIHEYDGLLDTIKPLIKSKKIIISPRRFRKLHGLLSRFFMLAEMLQLIPDINDLPKKKKRLALDARNRSHRLVKPIELFSRRVLQDYMKVYSRKQIQFLLPEEVFDKRTILEDALKNRSRAYLYFNGRIYTSRGIGTFLRKHHFELEGLKTDHLDQPNFLNGTCAYPGRIRGRAKIVFKASEARKVTKADILVAPMTMPTYSIALHRARGFVTDEGGIGCHAAIISRELKKPCLVATKKATQVFRDGDLIDLDATNGRVTLLKRA